MSADEIIDKNKGKIKMLSVLALIFSLGFACGYYYIDASQGGATVTIQDKSADCTALFEKSTIAVVPENAVNTASGGETTPKEKGAVLSSSDTANQQFAGSKNSTLYHTRNCQYVKRIKAENVVWFASSAEAAAEGKTAHGCVE